MDMKFFRQGSVNVNGQTFVGNNVSIVNGVVKIDGVVQDSTFIQRNETINVIVEGDVKELNNTTGDITAHNVGEITVQTGNVKCANVVGNVETMTGDITCGNVGGKATTRMGNINRR